MPTLEIEAYTWSENDEVLTLSFTSNFSSYTVYNVTISTNVTDLAGNNLPESYNFWFRTRDIIPPHPNAGLDKEVNEDELVVLDGSQSWDDNQITNWTWHFVEEEEILLYGEIVEYVFTQPGFYVVTLTVYDVSNNSATDVVNITVKDITPPVANAGEDLTVNEDVEVELDASLSQDNVAIVNWTWSFIDQTESIKLYGEIVYYTFTQPGIYVISLTVYDSSGNKASDFVNITVKDSTPPVIEIISPINGTLTNQNVTLIYVVSDNVDFSENITITGPKNCTVYTEDNIYTITIVAKASSNNIAEATLSFTIDKTPPFSTYQLEGILGDNGWYVSPVEIIITSEDNLSGLAKLLCKIDDNDWLTVPSPATLNLVEGIHEISFYALDNAGNEEKLKIIDIKIDQTPPWLVVETPQNNTRTTKSSIEIVGTIEPNITLLINNELVDLTDGTFTHLVSLVRGENESLLTAKDKAGNIRTEVLTIIREEEAKPSFIPGFETIYLFFAFLSTLVLVSKKRFNIK